MRSYGHLLSGMLIVGFLCCHSGALATQIEPTFVDEFQNWKLARGLTIRSLYFSPNWPLYARQSKHALQRGRIMLQLDKQGKATVNPKIEKYSWMWHDAIDPAKITRTFASMALAARGNRDQTMTCDLLPDSGYEVDVYHLDLRLDGDAVSAYRIRGVDISDPQWVGVLSKSSEMGNSRDKGELVGDKSAESKDILKDVSVRAVSKIELSNSSSIFIKSDGTISLSVFPQYGKLEEVTKDKAVELFGSPVVEEKRGTIEYCSYQLAELAGTNNAEIEVYHLDCKYGGDGRLICYRVRAASMPNTGWVRVNI